MFGDVSKTISILGRKKEETFCQFKKVSFQFGELTRILFYFPSVVLHFF